MAGNPSSPRKAGRPDSARLLKSLADSLSQDGRGPLKISEDHVQSVLIVRRARRKLLGEDLFSDPAWDILLELFAAHLGGRSMSVSDLARAVEAPLSTTNRWLSALSEKRLAVREPPSHSTAKLTREGAEKL